MPAAARGRFRGEPLQRVGSPLRTFRGPATSRGQRPRWVGSPPEIRAPTHQLRRSPLEGGSPGPRCGPASRGYPFDLGVLPSSTSREPPVRGDIPSNGACPRIGRDAQTPPTHQAGEPHLRGQPLSWWVDPSIFRGQPTLWEVRPPDGESGWVREWPGQVRRAWSHRRPDNPRAA